MWHSASVIEAIQYSTQLYTIQTCLSRVPSALTSTRGRLTLCMNERFCSETQIEPSHEATSSRSPSVVRHEMSSLQSYLAWSYAAASRYVER